MAEVAVAYVTLLPSARGFRQNTVRTLTPHVSRASTQLGTTFSSGFNRSVARGLTTNVTGLNSAFRQFGTSASRSIAGVTAATGALGGALGGLGLSTAAFLQQAEIGFGTLLDSAKKASSFLTDVRNFAVATPFEVESLVGNARALLGVGVAARDVIPTLTQLGNVTAAFGLNQEQFNGILRAYTQIASKGKVQAEELLQISENGLPAMQLFAKGLGVSVSQLLAMTQAGELTANEALPALLKQLNKDYGGSMARQFNTLTGVFNNFKESTKLALSDALQPLVPILQSALPAATARVGAGLKVASAAIKDFITGFQGGNVIADGRVTFFEKLGQGAQAAAGFIQQAFQSVLPTLRRFGNFITQKLVPAFVQNFGPLLPKLRQAFSDIGATISEHQNTFRALGQILTQIIVPALARVAGFLIDHLGPAFKTVMNVVRNFVIPLFITLADTILGVFDLIISGAATAFGWLPGVGGKLKDANRAFDNFAVGVNNSLRNIERLVQVDVVIRVRQTTADIAGGFDGETLTPQQAAAKQRQRVIDSATNATKAAKDAAKAKAAGISDAFGGIGKLAGQSMADGLDSKKGAAAKAAKDLVDETKQKALDALKDAQQELRDFSHSIRDGLRSFGDLTTISSTTGAAATPNSLKRFLDTQLRKIKEFQSNLKALVKRGLPASILRKIAESGVEQGGPIAEALVRANKEQFNGLVSVQQAIDKRAANTGKFVAGQVLGPKVAEARTVVEHLEVTVNNPRAERASDSTPKAVRRALIRAGA